MRHMNLRSHLFAAAVALAALATPATAQQGNIPRAAVITNTQAPLATTDVVGTPNLTDRGAICTFNQVSHSGTPSTTIEIQFQDAASGTWNKLVTSGAITADATPTSIVVYPGAVATSVPTGMVIAGLKLPTAWRVHQVIGGSAGSALTGTVGCELLN